VQVNTTLSVMQATLERATGSLAAVPKTVLVDPVPSWTTSHRPRPVPRRR
jgi:hypothetical protein